MTKKTATYELTFRQRNPGVPAYQWLYEAVRSDILGGRLRPGTRLPATRNLAGQYGLARGTIVNAFDQLASEGYVEGSVGSGTYVSKVLPEKLLQVASGPAAPPRARLSGGQSSPTTVDEPNYLGAMRTGRLAPSGPICRR
jgi:GntR family transcriptional regulator / MocR family aminotransferase